MAENPGKTEVAVEPETGTRHGNRKGNAKSRRQPRSPVTGAGNGINMPEYKDHEFFEQVDDSPRRRKLEDAFWHMDDEDWAAEERHWAERERENGEGR